MLDALITSKTRKKLLLKFFLNSESFAYLRNLEHELDESPNALRVELNKFEKANMLVSKLEGNKKIYYANTAHPLFSDIRSIIIKTIGLDQIINRVINHMGDVEKVFVTGNLAKGVDSKIVDLLFVGNNINVPYLVKLIKRTELIIKKRIRYLTVMPDEIESYMNPKNAALLIWDMKK